MVRLLPVLLTTGAVLGLIDIVTGQYYASKYDHIDVDAILNNRRIVNYYALCLLSQGPCPPEGLEFKRILPEALRTNCQRCTEKQRTVTLRAIRRLKKEYPKIWAQLEQQWDPDGIYISKFESTFGAKPSESLPQPSLQILNRFGGPDNENKSIETTNRIPTTPTTTTPTTTTTKTTSTASSTTSSSTTTTAASTTKTTTPSTVSTKAPITKTTPHRTSTLNVIHQQNINTISATTKPTRRPRPTLGQSIQATVEVVKSIEKMVSQIAREKLEFISRLLTG